MTTIAYKDGVIATDSLLTAGNVIVDHDADKYYVREEIKFFIAGVTSDHEKLIEEYLNPAGRQVGDTRALVVDGGKLFKVGSEEGGKGLWRCPLRRNNPAAIGTGADFALVAMDFGHSAEKAVAYAMTRDVFTGGEIKTYKVFDNVT